MTTGTHGGLAACPFCGGAAEWIDIDDGENAGGSCISCTVCLASSNVEFGRKENFVSNWNRRALSAPPLAEEAVKKALGLAMAALQTIQGMEPITHEITLPTVMAQHATDALNDIRALHNGFCTNPCGEGSCAGELRIALVCDRCGWEDPCLSGLHPRSQHLANQQISL